MEKYIKNAFNSQFYFLNLLMNLLNRRKKKNLFYLLKKLNESLENFYLFHLKIKIGL